MWKKKPFDHSQMIIFYPKHLKTRVASLTIATEEPLTWSLDGVRGVITSLRLCHIDKKLFQEAFKFTMLFLKVE